MQKCNLSDGVAKSDTSYQVLSYSLIEYTKRVMEQNHRWINVLDNTNLRTLYNDVNIPAITTNAIIS